MSLLSTISCYLNIKNPLLHVYRGPIFFLAQGPCHFRAGPARDYVMSRAPSCTPRTHGRMDEWGSMSQSLQMLEVVVVRSPSLMRFGCQPTTTRVGVLARTDAIMSPSPSPPPAHIHMTRLRNFQRNCHIEVGGGAETTNVT